MKFQSRAFSLPKAALACALLALTGCNLFDDKDDKKPPVTAGDVMSVSYTVTATYVMGLPVALLPAITFDTTNGQIDTDTLTLSFFVQPALPAGLSLNASTGVITGTPTQQTDSIAYVVGMIAAGDTVRDTLGFAIVTEWYGVSLDSLSAAQSLAFRDGRLYVTHRHASKPGTAVFDVATDKIVAYYSQLLKPSGMAFTEAGHLVVGEGTWGQAGGISVIDPVAKTIRQSVISFDQDNAVKAVDGRVYLIDRTAGVVTGFTGNTPGQNITLDVQTGANSNPYGIAVSGGKAYIPRYNKASLLILGDVNALGGGTRDSIDLSAYAHAGGGGIPFMSGVIAHGGYVFVTLERWKSDYSTQDSGLVVVINAATKAIEKTITLNFKNPGGGVVRDGAWYIAGLGAYMVNDGGVEKIDLATRTHAGTVVTEATLGGDVGSIAITGANAGYATYSTDFFATTRIKKFAP